MEERLQVFRFPRSRAVLHNNFIDVLRDFPFEDEEGLEEVRACNRINGENAVKIFPNRFNFCLEQIANDISINVDHVDVFNQFFLSNSSHKWVVFNDQILKIASNELIQFNMIPALVANEEGNYRVNITTHTCTLKAFMEPNKIPHIADEINLFKNISFQQKLNYLNSRRGIFPQWAMEPLPIVFKCKTYVRTVVEFFSMVSELDLHCDITFEKEFRGKNLILAVTKLFRWPRIVHSMRVHPTLRTKFSKVTINNDSRGMLGLLYSNLKFRDLVIDNVSMNHNVTCRAHALTIRGDITVDRFPTEVKSLTLENISFFQLSYLKLLRRLLLLSPR